MPPPGQERLDQAQQDADVPPGRRDQPDHAWRAPAASTGEPAVPPGQWVRVVTTLLEPDPAANSADLRDALLRADAISSETPPGRRRRRRPACCRSLLAGPARLPPGCASQCWWARTGWGAVLDELYRMGARRSGTFVQEAERGQS
ncbi:hypothetical protein [Micromonospora aurantiaca (nom. illeg.)]|uniref:hypothetical protein n=1 Tax=Micromonospora aurantiaca (nom. illeg.) TaxID=47850 RepID=UPI00340A4338